METAKQSYPQWGSKPYYPYARFLQERFGGKVYKVALNAGFTCPNLDGSKGRGGCTFCHAGSLAYYDRATQRATLSQQLEAGMAKLRHWYQAEQFIAYLQSYTNTYAPMETLRQTFTELFSHPEVAGVSVGTRADCLTAEILDMLVELSQGKYLQIELGVESTHNASLDAMNRCHHWEDAQAAFALLRRYSEIYVSAHLIYGLPGESEAQMLESLDKVVSEGIHGIKLHHLYIERGTQMAKAWRMGQLEPVTRAWYFDILGRSLPRIPPHVVIERLLGQSDKAYLLAPLWTLEKQRNISLLDAYLSAHGIWQGAEV